MHRMFAHLIDVRRIEVERVVLSGMYFFCILLGYYLLRAARESVGIENPEEVIKYLYVGTLVVTAIGNPLFSWAVSRFSRRVFVVWTYRFFMANIVVFALLMVWHPAAAHDAVPTAARLWVSRAFYVWVTVFALFNTMVFWAVMADTFRLDQSKRVYAPIAVGGTVGAIAGSACAGFLSGKIGTAWTVMVAIVPLEIAVWCFLALSRAARRAEAEGDRRDSGGSAAQERSIGGDAWAGFIRTMKSPYLLGSGGYIVFMSIVSTFFYFARLRVVAMTSLTPDDRTHLFAQVDLWSQIATLGVQLMLTSHMLRRAGVGVTMAALPVISFLSFGAVALVPTFTVMAISQAAYTAGRYAFARPARETLFTVLDREDRYKSKAFVDTFLFRAGDVMGAVAETGAKSFSKSLASAATNATVAALQTGAVVIGVVAVAWSALSIWLGRAQRRMAVTGGAGPGGDGPQGREGATGAPVG